MVSPSWLLSGSGERLPNLAGLPLLCLCSAGNRRSEMAAQKLVEGRAPWVGLHARISGCSALLCLCTMLQQVEVQCMLSDWKWRCTRPTYCC